MGHSVTVIGMCRQTCVSAGDDMLTPESSLAQQASLEALRNQPHNLEETISRLLEMIKSFSEG